MKLDTISKVPKVVHNQKSDYDVLIDRTTKWGNPYKLNHVITDTEALLLGDDSLSGCTVTRDQCIDLYKHYLLANETLMACLSELNGKILGCWCKNEAGTGKRCHGDMIAEVFIEELINRSLFEY